MSRRTMLGRNRIWYHNNDNRYNGNQFSEHNDRGELKTKPVHRSKNTRRVSFKPSGVGTGGRQFNNNPPRTLNLAIRTTLDDDEDMVDFANGMNRNRDENYQRNQNPRIRRRGSPIPRTGHSQPGMRKLTSGTSDWFLVTVPHGQKYDKEFMLTSMQGLVKPETFTPYCVKVESSALCFYVDDIKIAQILLNADRQSTLPDGFKMIIRVRNIIPPVQIDENLKEKMKLAMAKRFNATNKALDLTKFHTDVDLKDIFCALFRPTIMLEAIDIIAEKKPDLEELDLSDNKILSLHHLKCLAKKLPSLKILRMANNKIPSPNSLDALRECQLIDLVLEGNPLKDRFREKTVYISEIRKKFPKLQTLDFETLLPQMGFDIPDEISIPSSKASYVCNNSGADFARARQFLEEYFTVFDSDNRQPLVGAYHEHAMFSLTATHISHGRRLDAYWPHDRNLLRKKNFEERTRHLKNGRLPIVSFLSKLPATQHDPHSFAVDLSFLSEQLMLLTVTGIFRERAKRKENICSFQRILVIVPSGSGLCIKNEMLHINYATMVQIRTAFKSNVQPIAAAAPVPPPVKTTPSSTDANIKLQKIHIMAEKSNMNLEWSEKCLIETNWDFDRAAFVFTELNNQQKIPAEAFAK